MSSRFKNILFKTPLGLGGFFFIIVGIIFTPFAGIGILLPLWVLICGVCCVITALIWNPSPSTLLGQIAVLSLCPLSLIGFWLKHEYVDTDRFLFLIPSGYVGKVTVKYKLSEGEPVTKEGRQVVFKPDAEGNLISQYKGGKNIDLLNTEYYYVDENGNRQLIKNRETRFEDVRLTPADIYTRNDTAIWEFSIKKTE